MIRIGIADDHLFVRQGLMALLKEFEGIKIIFDVSNGQEVLEQLKTKKPDILLLDIEMPVMGGIETFEVIKVKYPCIKAIVFSHHYKASYIVEMMKMGASAFLSKNTDIEKIVLAINTVYKKGVFYDSDVAMILNKANMSPVGRVKRIDRPELQLSPREIDVIRLICQNKSTSEIAKTLFLSIRTVEWHRLHVWQKTNCKNPMELVNFSIQNNLISL